MQRSGEIYHHSPSARNSRKTVEITLHHQNTVCLLTKIGQGILSIQAYLTYLFYDHQSKGPPLWITWKEQYLLFSSVLINLEQASVLTQKASFNGSIEKNMFWVLFFCNLSKNVEKVKEFMWLSGKKSFCLWPFLTLLSTHYLITFSATNFFSPKSR